MLRPVIILRLPLVSDVWYCARVSCPFCTPTDLTSLALSLLPVGRTLGHGAFGMIYAATHVSNGQEYAIKIEPRSARHPQVCLVVLGFRGAQSERRYAV